MPYACCVLVTVFGCNCQVTVRLMDTDKGTIETSTPMAAAFLIDATGSKL